MTAEERTISAIGQWQFGTIKAVVDPQFCADLHEREIWSCVTCRNPAKHTEENFFTTSGKLQILFKLNMMLPAKHNTCAARSTSDLPRRTRVLCITFQSVKSTQVDNDLPYFSI